MCFDEVHFTYPGETRKALERVDLLVTYGKRVLVLGPSGSGKKSLVQLLARLYDPEHGAIRIGSVDLKKWDVERLRQQLAVVSQIPHLFTGTVRHNLGMARPDASESAMREACRIAQIQDLVADLLDGLDTWIGEAGSTLSGGEARRLSMARALLKDSPILVLDEPTEGLDSTTASNLLSAIDGATAGRTSLVISHRLIPGMKFDFQVEIRNGFIRSQAPV